jgi:hypothetical protein
VSSARGNRDGELVAGERLRIKEGEEERSAWVALCTQSGRSARSAHAREFRGGDVASVHLHGRWAELGNVATDSVPHSAASYPGRVGHGRVAEEAMTCGSHVATIAWSVRLATQPTS